MEGDDRPQWPWKVAALVNGRIRGKEILLSLCRRAHRDKAQCLHSLSVPIFLQPQVHGVMIWVQKELGLGPEQFPSHSFDLMHFSNKEVIKLIILSYDLFLQCKLLPCSMNDNAGLSVGCLFGPPPWSRPKYLKKTIGWTAMNLFSDIQGPKENIRMTVAIPWLSL